MIRLTPEDVALWEWVMSSVKPTARAKAVLPLGPAPPVKKPVAAKKNQPEIPAALAIRASSVPLKQIKAIAKGQVAIAATLDLHGMTQAAAHQALGHFITKALRENWIYVDIITGRGNPEKGTGVLRRLVPLWLEAMPQARRITVMTDIHQSRGGALRLKISKK